MLIDPLLSLLVGALGAALLGLLGAAIQARRDHKKWLRERRFDAYRTFMTDMDTIQDLLMKEINPSNADHTKERVNLFTQNFSTSFEAVSLLGPRAVNAAGQRWVWAANDLSKENAETTKPAFNAARWQFLVAAGRELKSSNVGSKPLTRTTDGI